MARCWYFGGPAHLDSMEIDDPKQVHSLVISKDDERATIDRQLGQKLGIPPPFGTYIAHYFYLSTAENGDRLYVFGTSEGENPWDEEELE
jgi:hypothetical protein